MKQNRNNRQYPHVFVTNLLGTSVRSPRHILMTTVMLVGLFVLAGAGGCICQDGPEPGPSHVTMPGDMAAQKTAEALEGIVKSTFEILRDCASLSREGR